MLVARERHKSRTSGIITMICHETVVYWLHTVTDGMRLLTNEAGVLPPVLKDLQN
jgi:hypothetical protein